jgi:hypothetical protein
VLVAHQSEVLTHQNRPTGAVAVQCQHEDISQSCAQDNRPARQLADRLTRGGFTVWLSEEEIAPGDNWAKKIGKALDDSELMVILLSPDALEADGLRQDIEFALGSKKYAGRVFSVFVGPALHADRDMPWILLKLPHCQVASPRDFGDVVKEIQAMSADSDMSPSNA